LSEHAYFACADFVSLRFGPEETSLTTCCWRRAAGTRRPGGCAAAAATGPSAWRQLSRTACRDPRSRVRPVVSTT
jgi:hypothetical protein